MPNTRINDPETSHEAAKSVKNLTETKLAILKLLQTAGRTDDELVRHYEEYAEAGFCPRASQSGIRSRRAEMVKEGLIWDSGDRAKLASGRSAIVWVAG